MRVNEWFIDVCVRVCMFVLYAGDCDIGRVESSV